MAQLKPAWFIQWPQTDREENIQTLIYTIKELDMPVFVDRYIPFAGMSYDFLPIDRPVIFIGSINLVKDLYARFANKFFTGYWADKTKLSCSHYYTHWDEYLASRNYGFYPLGIIPKHSDRLYGTYADYNDNIFIKPDANEKAFVGELVNYHSVGKWYDQVTTFSQLTDLCLVAEPVVIETEWRLIVHHGMVIAGSQYKHDHLLAEQEGYPDGARLLAETAASKWQPHSIFCLDIGLIKDEYKIIECGSINCAGLYACKLKPVVEALTVTAMQDWFERFPEADDK